MEPIAADDIKEEGFYWRFDDDDGWMVFRLTIIEPDEYNNKRRIIEDMVGDDCGSRAKGYYFGPLPHP